MTENGRNKLYNYKRRSFPKRILYRFTTRIVKETLKRRITHTSSFYGLSTNQLEIMVDVSGVDVTPPVPTPFYSRLLDTYLKTTWTYLKTTWTPVSPPRIFASSDRFAQINSASSRWIFDGFVITNCCITEPLEDFVFSYSVCWMPSINS